jgi:hypothetical protein
MGVTMKYYTFHCSNRQGNYRRIACGNNQSEAAGKLCDGETTARNLVCVTESKTRREAENCRPRIR